MKKDYSACDNLNKKMFFLSIKKHKNFNPTFACFIEREIASLKNREETRKKKQNF